MAQFLEIPSAIEKIQTLADRGNKLSILTPELTPEEMTILFTLRGKEGFMYFGLDPLKDTDLKLPPDTRTSLKKKSPTQRLRNVIYKVWETEAQDKMEFDDYYEMKMEQIINHLKEKIDV